MKIGSTCREKYLRASGLEAGSAALAAASGKSMRARMNNKRFMRNPGEFEARGVCNAGTQVGVEGAG
jgi:hypothetical protein